MSYRPRQAAGGIVGVVDGDGGGDDGNGDRGGLIFLVILALALDVRGHCFGRAQFGLAVDDDIGLLDGARAVLACEHADALGAGEAPQGVILVVHGHFRA